MNDPDERSAKERSAKQLYLLCREGADRMVERYDQLEQACDEQIATLRRLADLERAKPEPNTHLIFLLDHQVTYASEFLDVIQTIAHNALLRTFDRLHTVETAARGEFV